MENAANLLLGAVLIISLVALSALVLLRGKRRGNVSNRPGEPAAPVPTERTGLFARLFGIFRRGKKGEQSPMPIDLAQFAEAGLVASPESLVGVMLPEDQEALLAAVKSDSTQELTSDEAAAFRAVGGQSDNEDGSSSDSNSDEDKVSETLGDAFEEAFKTARIVDTRRKTLLARVPSVQVQDLAEEIKSLTTRIKVYVPDEPPS